MYMHNTHVAVQFRSKQYGTESSTANVVSPKTSSLFLFPNLTGQAGALVWGKGKREKSKNNNYVSFNLTQIQRAPKQRLKLF